jgi:hypothetical protein
VNGYKIKGKYEMDFDARKYASGVYFYKLTSGKNISIKKMLLAK